MNCAFQPGKMIYLDSSAFIIQEIIGRGSSCIVYKAKRQGMLTEHLLKEYHPSNIELERGSDQVLRLKKESDRPKFAEGLSRFIAGYQLQMHLREKDNLKNLICNVQAIHEGYGTHFIEMTVFSGKTYDKVTEGSLKELLLRIRAITQTVAAFHQEGYLLLDLKPENIFVDPKKLEGIILFDFDSVVDKSNIPDNWRPYSTRGWCAPELKYCNLKECNGEKMDVYSIGMILHHKLTGNLLDNESQTSTKPVISLDPAAELLKGADDKVVEKLITVLEYTLCSANFRWTPNKLIKKLDEMILLIDQQNAAAKPAEFGPAGPVHVQVDVKVDNKEVGDHVNKQFSKLHLTILAAAILICIPLFFLCCGFLFSGPDAPSGTLAETAPSDHLMQPEATGPIPEHSTNVQTEPDSTISTEPPTEDPTSTPDDSTLPPAGQSETGYAINTIAYISGPFRSLIVTNSGAVYYLDGSVISNSADGSSLDMEANFDSSQENGYLAYDPYRDIVYLLDGGSLTIYDITDLHNPKLINNSITFPLEYNSSITPQIAFLPDGTLLVPADLDGTYRVNPSTGHATRFHDIYPPSSYERANLLGDYILEWHENSTEATVYPLSGGQEYDVCLEEKAPSSSACALLDKVLFYSDGVGICEFGTDGEFSVMIPQENIRIMDYESLDDTNIWAIAANESGTIAIYDNTLRSIRVISPEQ